MPDGTQASVVDSAEDAAFESDERLVAGVGRRLVFWAAGTTLVVLVVLGVALYAAVNQTLTTTGVQQLDDRASALRRLIEGPTVHLRMETICRSASASAVAPPGRWP